MYEIVQMTNLSMIYGFSIGNDTPRVQFMNFIERWAVSIDSLLPDAQFFTVSKLMHPSTPLNVEVVLSF